MYFYFLIFRKRTETDVSYILLPISCMAILIYQPVIVGGIVHTVVDGVLVASILTVLYSFHCLRLYDAR